MSPAVIQTWECERVERSGACGGWGSGRRRGKTDDGRRTTDNERRTTGDRGWSNTWRAGHD